MKGETLFVSFKNKYKGQEKQATRARRNGCFDTLHGVKMKNHGCVRKRKVGRDSPDDESASDLQELPFTAEPLEKVDHELIKVGVHGRSGRRTF